MGIKNKKQQKTQQNGQSTGPELKFYLKEFSGRLLLLVGSFVVAAIVGFEFKDIIQTLVTLQLADLNMVNFAQAEGALPTLQISLLAGVLGGLPFAVYHVYRFFAPVLARGAWYGFRMVSGSVALLISAVTYAFMVTIPLGLSGMVAATETHVATQTFLTFVVGNVIVAALLSQLPIMTIFWGGIKPFSTKKFLLLQGLGVAIIVFSTAMTASFASPAKGITGMLLLAVPAIVLFEASIFWAKIHGRVIIKDMPEELVAELAAQELAKNKSEKVREVQLQPIRETVAVHTAAATTMPIPESQAASRTFEASVAAPIAENAQPTLEDIFDAMLADDSDEPEEYYQDEVEPVAQPVHVPVFQAPHAPVAPVTPQPSVPTASYMGMPAYRPQPLPQPQPVPTRRPAYSRPIVDMLRPSQATTPQLRSLHTPRQTIPFQTTAAH